MLENNVDLCGTVIGDPQPVGDGLWLSVVGVRRSSGIVDHVRVVTERKPKGAYMQVSGRLKSHDVHAHGASHLFIYVKADTAACAEMQPERNAVYIGGYICSEPRYYEPPAGKEVANFILALPKEDGGMDYAPCVSWGGHAKYIGALPEGTKLSVSGKMHSRKYKTEGDDGRELIRTAYEVSVQRFDVLPSERECEEKRRAPYFLKAYMKNEKA